MQAPSVTNELASVTDQLSNSNGHDDSLVVSDKKYDIPPRFNTVKSMLSHWSTDVGIKDISNDMKWRQHLTKADTKRFCRVRRVVTAFTDQVNMRERDEKDVAFQFETYYSTNRKSLASLDDKFAKNLLTE